MLAFEVSFIQPSNALPMYTASVPISNLLLKAGARLRNGYAPTIAVQEERVEVVKLLLNHRADTNAKPDNEEMYENRRELGAMIAPCSAEAEGRVEIVRMLLEDRQDKNITDTSGTSAMELAKSERGSVFVNVLMAYGSQHCCKTA